MFLRVCRSGVVPRVWECGRTGETGGPPHLPLCSDALQSLLLDVHRRRDHPLDELLFEDLVGPLRHAGDAVVFVSQVRDGRLAERGSVWRSVRETYRSATQSGPGAS